MSEESPDDDWFERALSDDGDETDGSGGAGETDASGGSGETGSSGGSGESGPTDESDETDPTALSGESDDRDPPAETSASPDSDTDLEEAAEAAFDRAQAGIDGAGQSGGGDPFGDSGSGLGDGSGGPGPGGDLSSTGGGGSLFDDDFESAFASAGPDEEAFDDEALDSDIPRIDLGIEGLDAMIQGGVPERHLVVVVGSAGTGKTTFGLQFLNHGLEQGENAIFITLEQSHDAIMATADEWGWGFQEYEDEGRLAVVDLDPVEMANSLDNIRSELPDLVEEFDADRLVLDSVSLLEMMYENQAHRRTEIYDFTRALKRAGVTTMLTSEANENNHYASRYGIIEYLTDAVFILRYVRSGNQETRLAVEIQKIRNANHSRETKPYEITTEGLSVYQQASIF